MKKTHTAKEGKKKKKTGLFFLGRNVIWPRIHRITFREIQANENFRGCSQLVKLKYKKFLPYIYLIIGESSCGRHHLYAYWLVLSHPTTTQYLPRDRRKRGGEGRQRFISHIVTRAVKKKKERRGNEFQPGSSHAIE